MQHAASLPSGLGGEGITAVAILGTALSLENNSGLPARIHTTK